MNEEKYPYYEEEYDEIDVKGMICKLFKNRKKLFKWACIAGVLGLVVGFSIPKTYRATAKVAPEIAQKSSGMGSLAALAGINLNTVAVTDAMYPDLYPEIVRSIPFRIELFDMPVRIIEKKDTVYTDLYDYFANYSRKPWWDAVMKVPSKLTKAVRSIFVAKKEPILGHEHVNPSKLTGEQTRVMGWFGESIEMAIDKKTFVLTITVSTQNAKVSADLCQLVVDNIQKYVVNYRTEKSRKDLAYYEQLNEEARKAYYEAQQKFARYTDANQGVVFQRVLIERERLQNEANLKYQLYNTTSQQVQQATAKVQHETPVCVTIQPPTVPLKNATPSKFKIILIFMFMGAFFASVWYLWGENLRDKIRAQKAEEKSASWKKSVDGMPTTEKSN